MHEDENLPPVPRWYGGTAAPAGETPGVPPVEPRPAPRDWAAEFEDAHTQTRMRTHAQVHTQAPGAGTGSVRDDVRAVGAAFVGRDLLRPGPGLWPFGRKARARREQRHAIDEEAKRRRTELLRRFEREPTATSVMPRGQWRAVDPRTNRTVIASLAAVVLLVFGVTFYFSTRGTSPPPSPQPAAAPGPADSSLSSVPASSAAPGSASSGTVLPPRPPIPYGGVAPITPVPGQVLDPASVTVFDPPVGPPTPAELATPEGAVSAWLARWCPFTSAEPIGTAEARARHAMTENGWSRFDPTTNEKARESWVKTVAANESGHCGAVSAAVSPEAPRGARSAIVIAAANRVVYGTGAAPYAEQVSDTRIVLLGDDGLWRVDLPTAGG